MQQQIDILTCPITQDLLVDPVSLPCGQSVSRAALLEWLQTSSTCPSCRADLSAFDAANACRNVAVSDSVELLRQQLGPGGIPKAHQWTATFSAVPNVIKGLLSLRVEKARFATRPTLFVSVVDRSGSMNGRPWNQVETALLHILGVTQDNPMVRNVIIGYDSSAEIIDLGTTPEDGRKVVKSMYPGGGTNFQSAFKCIEKLMRKVVDVGSVVVAFMTDGQDSSADVEVLRRIVSNRTLAVPVTIHVVGFGSGCDKNLLEKIRTCGTADGTFRYAEPGDSGDSLCEKMTDLFSYSANSYAVPVRVGEEHVVLGVDENMAGRCSIWTAECKEVVVHSSHDNGTVVPVEQSGADVTQQWYSHVVDAVAGDVLELARSSGDVRLLKVGLYKQNLRALLMVSDDERVPYLLEQVGSVGSLDVGMLSDMRFGSMFSGGGAKVSAAPKEHVRNVFVPRAAEQKAVEWSERKVRYSRNSEGRNRNMLQRQIMNPACPNGPNPSKDMEFTRESLSHTDANGNNALHLAAYSGRDGVVRRIVDAGVLDLNAENADNETATTLAIKGRGFLRTLMVLCAAGAGVPRCKYMQKFASAHGFSRTEAFLASLGDANNEVDLSMTVEYFRVVWERIAESGAVYTPSKVLEVALARAVPDVALEMLEQGCVPTFEQTSEHCFPPKADHPEVLAYLELVKMVVSHCPALLAEHSADGGTLLHRAVECGSLEHVRYFATLLPLEDENDKGNSPLWIACAKRYPCIVDELVDAEADVNHANHKGNVPLYSVCSAGPAKVASTLIAAGATLEHVNANGDTLPLICCRSGQYETLAVLCGMVEPDFLLFKAHIDGFDCTLAAAEAGRPECIRVLHECGLPLDSVTDADNPIIAGATALHVASYYGRVAAIQKLVELGANVDATDASGMTALHIAVIKSNSDTVAVLRGAGADVTVTDRSENTATAYCRGNVEIRDMLVDSAVRPLMMLAGGEFTKAFVNEGFKVLRQCAGVEGVLSARRALDVRDDLGRTPLAVATMSGNRRAVEVLVDMGADPCAADRMGLTPRFWAEWRRDTILKRLLDTTEGPSQALTDLCKKSAGRNILFMSSAFVTAYPPSSVAVRMAEAAKTEGAKTIEGPERVTVDANVAMQAKAFAVATLAGGDQFGMCPDNVLAIALYTGSLVATRAVHNSLGGDLSRHLLGALDRLPPYTHGEVYVGAASVDRDSFREGATVSWPSYVSGSTMWPVASDAAGDIAKRGTVFIVVGGGRLVSAYSQYPYDMEVIFAPRTTYVVRRWYRGDPVCLGQSNIREHTFGVKAEDVGRYLDRQKDRPLIILLEAVEYK